MNLANSLKMSEIPTTFLLKYSVLQRRLVVTLLFVAVFFRTNFVVIVLKSCLTSQMRLIFVS